MLEERLDVCRRLAAETTVGEKTLPEDFIGALSFEYGLVYSPEMTVKGSCETETEVGEET